MLVHKYLKSDFSVVSERNNNKLEVVGLSKSYNGIQVIKDLSFSVERGEVLAVVGKNGSGKTTLLKLISGISEKDSGTIKLYGKDISHHDVRSKILFVGHFPNIYSHLTVFENLVFWAKIWGKNCDEKNIKFALDFFGILKFKNYFVHQLSQGIKRKVSLCKFFIIDPDVLVVDEPFSNIDDFGREKISELFSRCKKENKIVIFSSPEKKTEFKADLILDLDSLPRT